MTGQRPRISVGQWTAWTGDSGAAALVVGVTTLLVAGLLASRLGYVPMWDGRVYADCIVSAAERFTLPALRCGGHASEAYVAYMAFVQKLAPASYVPMLVANAMLLAAAAVAFSRLFAIAFPGPQLELESALLTAAFALNPAILASVVQPGLDFPLAPELLWCLVFLLEGKTVGVIALGLTLAFTKETGVLLYAVLVACYAWLFVLRSRSTHGSRIAGMVRLLPLAIPPLCFGAYLLYRSRTTPAGTAVMWNATTTGEGFLHQFLVPRLDLYLINYLVMWLFMNFAWIASGFIAADAFVGAVHAAHRMPRRRLDGADPRAVAFLTLVTFVTGYALTRFATFGNSRYLVPLMTLLPFPFMAALVRLRVPPRGRRLLLGGFAAVLCVSAVRTVDPVSRRLYGTFPVGSNDMLHMTRITGECCGLGRDQLVYNLEFTSLDALTQRALATLPRVDSVTLVLPDSTNWSTIGQLDPRSHRRTLSSYRSLRPSVLEPRDVLAATARPTQLYYFALPYASAARGLQELQSLYDVEFERRYEDGGYVLPVYALTARNSSSTASGENAGASGSIAGRR